MPLLEKLFAVLVLGVGGQAAAPLRASLPNVELRRVPEGGIQPQVAVAEDGSVHALYFKGDPQGGDLFYIHSADGTAFSAPFRVNTIPGSAIAIGNIRGAHIAVGRNKAVYVAWNGSPRAAHANGERVPMLFTRLNQSQTAFEPERNLIASAYGLDGGGGVAADRSGRVFVFWHAPAPASKGEQNRRIWMARSQDDGKTFEHERMAWNEATGACGCCSLNAAADQSGRVFVLFRSADAMVHRDMYLLKSDNHAGTFTGAKISPWTVGYCVMSSEAFAATPKGILMAWETEKKVHFGLATSGSTKVTDNPASSGTAQKYPTLAFNKQGLDLVAWTEGMAWKHGGSLHWQLFDGSAKGVGAQGAVNGVPAWSLVAAYARRDGSFVIFY